MNEKHIAAFEDFQFAIGQIVMHAHSHYGEQTGIIVERSLVETPNGIERWYVTSFPGDRGYFYEIELTGL